MKTVAARKTPKTESQSGQGTARPSTSSEAVTCRAYSRHGHVAAVDDDVPELGRPRLVGQR